MRGKQRFVNHSYLCRTWTQIGCHWVPSWDFSVSERGWWEHWHRLQKDPATEKESVCKNPKLSRTLLHLPERTKHTPSLFLPEQWAQLTESLFAWEPVVEHPLLSCPHSQGPHVLQQVAADVLWSQLLVEKAKRHEFADLSSESFQLYMNGKKQQKRTHIRQSCRLCFQDIMINQDFKVMSTTNGLTSIFWDPSFTLGDCRMDMTDCQD